MDADSIRMEAREERGEDMVRRINSRRALRVNSASEEEPTYICEGCFEEECRCEELGVGGCSLNMEE